MSAGCFLGEAAAAGAGCEAVPFVSGRVSFGVAGATGAAGELCACAGA